MPNDLDNIDREYLREMARILGHTEGGHEKVAALAPALQQAVAKKAEEKKGMKKIASMPLRGLLEDDNFKRGFEHEIETRRHIWEPAVVAWLRGEE